MKPILAATLLFTVMPVLPCVAQSSAAPAPAKVATFSSEARVYKKAGERELKLFIEKPADWKASDQRPALLFFFGGGWVGGSPAQFQGQSEYFATRGMVGIRVEYRVIAKGDPGPPIVCTQDAKSAMRWVRSHAGELGIDPKRIGAGGGSAGGHLAAFVGMVEGQDDPSHVYGKCVIIYALLEISADETADEAELEVEVKVQACNSKTCEPPETKKLIGKRPLANPGDEIKRINESKFPKEGEEKADEDAEKDGKDE